MGIWYKAGEYHTPVRDIFFQKDRISKMTSIPALTELATRAENRMKDIQHFYPWPALEESFKSDRAFILKRIKELQS